jgi:single-strand DNA-binding protein
LDDLELGMFDTPITVVGNVLTAPEWRRTTTTGTFVVTFKVASTSRRYDKDRNTWVDGDTLRVKVACWRRLGENVSLSVQLGDPVIVYGRMYSRDWVDAEGVKRTSYELDAVCVGHDLSRGVDKFARRRLAGTTDTVDDPVGAATVGGEVTEPIADPGRPGDLPPDHELFDSFDPALFEGGATPTARHPGQPADAETAGSDVGGSATVAPGVARPGRGGDSRRRADRELTGASSP